MKNTAKILALPLLTGLFVSCSPKQDDGAKEQPNILFIMSDDHA